MNLNGVLNSTIDELVTKVLPSLVIVKGHRYGAGAGFVWGRDGLILTNNHVVGRRAPIVRLVSDGEYESRLIVRDADFDLALLKIEAPDLTLLAPAPDPVKVGEMVFAFGHPWGQRNSVSSGIVSAVLTAQTPKGRKIPVIRSDAPLAPGNSGGPLVNAHGQVVGINAMIMGGDQSLAIGISAAREFSSKFINGLNPQSEPAEPIPEGVL